MLFNELVVMSITQDPSTLAFLIDILDISLSTQHYLVCEMLVNYSDLASYFVSHHAPSYGVRLPLYTEEILLNFSIGVFSDYELFDGTIRICQLLQPMHSFLLERFVIHWDGQMEELARSRLDAFSAGLDSIGLPERPSPLGRSTSAPNLLLVEEEDSFIEPLRPLLRSSKSMIRLNF